MADPLKGMVDGLFNRLQYQKEHVYLEESYFDVVAAKTDNGIRKVPIADKVLPFFRHWMQKDGSDYLLCYPDGSKLKYETYKDAYWHRLLRKHNLEHLPHDTRHTTISLLAKAEVNQTIIKRIVGHAGAMSLTERVYTHFEIQQLIDAINKI